MQILFGLTHRAAAFVCGFTKVRHQSLRLRSNLFTNRSYIATHFVGDETPS